MIIDLLLIAVIVSFIIDISGFIDSVKKLIIVKILKFDNYDISLKPFDCSLCLTFWFGLLYLYMNEALSLPYITVVCLLAFFSTITTSLLLLVKDILISIINKIYTKLE